MRPTEFKKPFGLSTTREKQYSYTEYWHKFKESMQGQWRWKDMEELLPLCERIDAFEATKGFPYIGLISLRQIFIWYNLETKFKDFEGQEFVKSIGPGFGGSGGQILPYTVSPDGKQCYQPNYVGGKPCEYWNECDDDWFAAKFFTFDQWAMYHFFEA